MTRADFLHQLRLLWASLRRPAGVAPRPSRWAWTADLLLAAAVTGAVLFAASRNLDMTQRPVPDGFGGFMPQAQDPQFPSDTPQLLFALLTGLPLALRRLRPLTGFWLVILGARLFNPGRFATDAELIVLLACVMTAYSAAVYSPYRRATAVSILMGALTLLTHRNGVFPAITPSVLPFVLLLVVILTVNATGMWKQRVQMLEEQQEAMTRQAVERERARIAAELHDVVTHNVSVMVVQAGAARKVLDTSPEMAREALLAVESGGRAAMAELRHVMGLLTMKSQGGDAEGLARDVDLAPQPGLDQVPALADRMRDAGVRVGVQTLGTPVPLPSGVDLAAYRVVQEALTNTVKHAAGAEVVIRIAYAADSVRIDVTDTGGTRTSAVVGGNGRGLIGLRERLAVYGGTLHAGSRLSGGYRVSATIPLEGMG